VEGVVGKTEAFVHRNAIVEAQGIGERTRIWAFTHVMNGAHIGRDCNIGEQCFAESGVVVGNSVVIKNGVALWNGVEIGDNVFVGPNVVFTNDLMPRAKLFRSVVPTRVREGASIGANATVCCGIEIGRWAMVGAGSVVTRDVPEFAMVFGNPARVRGYVCKCGEKLRFIPKDLAECSCGMRFNMCSGAVTPVGMKIVKPENAVGIVSGDEIVTRGGGALCER
jgi:acetyltransferase-like isoleucine patch superfamily enzyme